MVWRVTILVLLSAFYVWYGYFLATYREVSKAYERFFITRSIPYYLESADRRYRWGETVDASNKSPYFNQAWHYAEHKFHFAWDGGQLAQNPPTLILNPVSSADGLLCLDMTLALALDRTADKEDNNEDDQLQATRTATITVRINDLPAIRGFASDYRMSFEFDSGEIAANSELIIELFLKSQAQSQVQVQLFDFSVNNQPCS